MFHDMVVGDTGFDHFGVRRICFTMCLCILVPIPGHDVSRCVCVGYVGSVSGQTREQGTKNETLLTPQDLKQVSKPKYEATALQAHDGPSKHGLPYR